MLRENPKVGLVSPNRHLVPINLFLGTNETNIRDLLKIYAINPAETDLSKALFVAGSMFWFRNDALSLSRSRSATIKFERERGQLDGTMAHAHERVFSMLAEHSGFISVTIDELKQREEPEYRALPASERAKKDADEFSNVAEL